MSDDLTPPKPGAADHLLAAVRATTGAVPYAGGALVELMNVAGTPLLRRQQRWMQTVADVLTRHEGLLGRVGSNEAFLTAFAQASAAATRTPHETKLRALRTAVVRTAVGTDLADDLQQLFVRFIDELTPSHIRLLHLLAQRERGLANLESFDQLMEGTAPDWGLAPLTRDELRLLCADLQTRSLLCLSPTFADISGEFKYKVIVGMAGGAGERPLIIVTELARSFLSYIADPSGPDDNDAHE